MVQVRFIESNVEDLSMLEDSSFDIVFSAYALGFVEDIRRTFGGIRRVLRPGGLFAFSWMAPMYAITREGALDLKRSYFDRSPIIFREASGTEVHFHRTYGDWHRALTEAGFVVTDILEPEPLPKEKTYADVFPLEKIRMIPGRRFDGPGGRGPSSFDRRSGSRPYFPCIVVGCALQVRGPKGSVRSGFRDGQRKGRALRPTSHERCGTVREGRREGEDHQWKD